MTALPVANRDTPGSAILQAWRQQHGPEATRAASQQPVQTPAQRPVRRAAPRMVSRGYAAADVSNLTASFQADVVPLNQELERTLRLMVGRARALAKNNDYVRHFLRLVVNHVVGPRGFALSVPCLNANGKIDELDKAAVEAAFGRWAKRGTCDVTRRLSFTQVCRLLELCQARDGEVFVRRVRDRSINEWGYALQIIDPLLVDHTYRADLADGNRIRMGVEFDKWGGAVAYHVIDDVETAWTGGRRVRVPATEMWHMYVQEEPGQLRGVPWIYSAMRRLNDLGGYEEAAIIAARVGAANMGFFVPPGEEAAVDTAQLADEVMRSTDAHGAEQIDLVKDATPGTFEQLPPGWDFKSFNPDYPHQGFDSFVKAMLRGVSSGVGVDYPSLASDLTGVNYSSIRAGRLETQDAWMCLQQDFISSILEPLGTEWLSMAFVSGQLGKLPVSKFDKFDCFVWQGRRWAWVDPMKDIQAKQAAVNLMVETPSDIMRETGRDPEAVYRQYEQDCERIDKIRKRFPWLKGGAPPGQAANTNPQTPAPAGVAVSGDDPPDDPADEGGKTP